MKEKKCLSGIGCIDILSEMERIHILGGGIGGDGGVYHNCTHIECHYNTGCPNMGCGTNTGTCGNSNCVTYTGCGITPADLFGDCPG